MLFILKIKYLSNNVITIELNQLYFNFTRFF
jgi:hypothetical protein